MAAAGGSLSYSDKLLSYGFNPLFPLNELTGAAADNAEGTASYDGTYSNVTLNNTDGPVSGERAGLWVPASNSYCDIYSASLSSAFNGNALTIVFWQKNLSWNDGTQRRALRITGTGGTGTNEYQFFQNNADDSFILRQTASSTIKAISASSGSPAGWTHWALTVSLANNRMIAYKNGAQFSTTATSLGTWTATGLSSTVTLIGAATKTGTQVMSGHMAYVGIVFSELSAAAVADIATV